MRYVNDIIGVYSIRNLKSNKIYIGSSKYLRERIQRHKRELRNSIHPNSHLLSAYQKYGEDSFEFIVIEECSLDVLHEREQYYIDTYFSYLSSKGYNMSRYVDSPKYTTGNPVYVLKDDHLHEIVPSIKEFSKRYGISIPSVHRHMNTYKNFRGIIFFNEKGYNELFSAYEEFIS